MNKKKLLVLLPAALLALSGCNPNEPHLLKRQAKQAKSSHLHRVETLLLRTASLRKKLKRPTT